MARQGFAGENTIGVTGVARDGLAETCQGYTAPQRPPAALTEQSYLLAAPQQQVRKTQ